MNLIAKARYITTVKADDFYELYHDGMPVQDICAVLCRDKKPDECVQTFIISLRLDRFGDLYIVRERYGQINIYQTVKIGWGYNDIMFDDYLPDYDDGEE